MLISYSIRHLFQWLIILKDSYKWLFGLWKLFSLFKHNSLYPLVHHFKRILIEYTRWLEREREREREDIIFCHQSYHHVDFIEWERNIKQIREKKGQQNRWWRKKHSNTIDRCAYVASLKFPTFFSLLFFLSHPSILNNSNGYAHEYDLRLKNSFIDKTSYRFKQTSSLDEIFIELTRLMFTLYEKFRLPFRIKNISSDQLNSYESMRLDYELFLPSKNSYVPTGSISLIGDYISRRLMIRYKKTKETTENNIIEIYDRLFENGQQINNLSNAM